MKKIVWTFIILACIYAGLYAVRAFSASGGFHESFKMPGSLSQISDILIGQDKPEGPENTVQQGNYMGKGGSGSSNFINNPLDILVLVNKEHNLNPDFAPNDLVKADVTFAKGVSKEEMMMRKEASDALKRMFSAAQKDGIKLCGVSGYRSYNAQAQTYNQGLKDNGIDYAEHYVAYPGQSEHQTGLAMDVGALNDKVQDFGKSKEGIWLKNNSQNFGFILRYPKGKEDVTGYNYEPWHIRYVGVKAAKEIKSKGMVLEEYIK